MIESILGLCIGSVFCLFVVFICVLILVSNLDNYEAKVSRLVEHLDRMARKENKDE